MFFHLHKSTFSTPRRKIMKFTDERVKVMNEVISGMKVIKLYTWEDSFAELVGKIRSYVNSYFTFV